MSLKERKDKLKFIHDIMKELQGAATEVLKPYLGGWEIAFKYICVPFWDCPKSPVGWCVYNHETDPAHDRCIFCNEPYERK